MRRGRTFVVSGPSGVGKSTVLKALLASRPNLYFSVSATTRAPRPGELDGIHYHFMDVETYDDIPVSSADVPENFKFCKENDTCKLLSYKGKVFSVEIPNFVELEITATEPGIKGNTATNTLKPATVETGAEIRVPLFINEGDKVRIDTRTGEYMERVN